MALTIKRTKSGLIIPTMPKLILPSTYAILGKSREEIIIEEEIKRIIRDAIKVKTIKDMSRIMFILIYKRLRGEKEISRIYLKITDSDIEKVLDVEAIEDTGVTLLEFFDYIIRRGAKEYQDPKKALEIM